MQAPDGPTNMARDLALLHAAEHGEMGWRVYLWDGAWVSLGRSQTPERALAPDWTRWCARPTGGKAVLHGHDVTFCLALPNDEGRAVRTLYRRMIAPLVEALNACGLPCALAEGTRFVDAPSGEDCFAARSPNDVVRLDTGAKVCGCALRATARGALLQASVPFRPPLVDPGKAILGGEAHDWRAWDHEGFEDAIRRALTSR